MTYPRHIDPCWYLKRKDWRVARLTELLLTGHSWRQVQRIMNMEKPEFDVLLDAAVTKVQNEQKQVEAERHLDMAG